MSFDLDPIRSSEPLPPDGGHVATDPACECAVLASVVFDGAVDDVAGLLNPNDLYTPAHPPILRAAIDLRSSNEATDVQSIASMLTRRRMLDRVGGVEYLRKLAAAPRQRDSVKTYCRLLSALARQRAVVDACRRVIADGTAGCDAPDLFVERASKRIADVCSIPSEDAPKLLRDVGRARVAELVSLKRSGLTPFGMPWDLPALNACTRGLLLPGVTVLAARSGAGKTIIGWQTARHVARTLYRGRRIGVLYVAGEMSAHDMWDNAVCSEASTDLDYYAANVDTDPRFVDAHVALEGLPISIRDRVASISDVRRAIREANAQFRETDPDVSVGLIVVDFAQMMKMRDAERRELALTQFVYDLLDISKEYRAHTLVLAQENQGKADGEAGSGNLRGGSGMADAADQMIILRRPYLSMTGDHDQPRWLNYAEFLVTKGRRNNLAVGVLRIEPEHSRVLMPTDKEMALYNEAHPRKGKLPTGGKYGSGRQYSGPDE